MENFTFCISTNVLFGRGQIERLRAVAEPFGTNALLVYGGESIKKIGVYDSIKKHLAGFSVAELSGVEANPKIESVRRGVVLKGSRVVGGE